MRPRGRSAPPREAELRIYLLTHGKACKKQYFVMQECWNSQKENTRLVQKSKGFFNVEPSGDLSRFGIDGGGATSSKVAPGRISAQTGHPKFELLEDMLKILNERE